MTSDQKDSRPTALVVDDDPILRIDMADLLEAAGFRMLEAGDGDEAIAVLEQHHLDVALLFSDVEMPGTRDGFALAHEVTVKWPAVKIVIASGRRRPGPGELPKGARFIGKPFSPEMVHGHLREVIPDHRMPKALRG